MTELKVNPGVPDTIRKMVADNLLEMQGKLQSHFDIFYTRHYLFGVYCPDCVA